MVNEKTYTAGEIAKIAGLDKNTVHQCIRREELSAVRLRDNGPWTITQRALDNFLEKRKQGYLKAV
jgi:hypothetical protein